MEKKEKNAALNIADVSCKYKQTYNTCMRKAIYINISGRTQIGEKEKTVALNS